MSGTDISYDATRGEGRLGSSLSLSLTPGTARYPPTRFLRDVRYWHTVCTRPGTGLACAAIGLRACYAVSAYAATSALGVLGGGYGQAARCRGTLPIFLRPSYPMSGTGIAHGAICLRACYALSGTEIADAARCRGTPPISLRASYLMSDTGIPYACYARPDIASSAICLQACYALSGTDVAYAARWDGETRCDASYRATR
eukprot:2498234-Rhodomonas_salina.3